MKQELEKLFKEIVAVNGKASNEYFMDKWMELCRKHDLQTVVKAWGDISENCHRWEYYEPKIWKNKLEFHAPDIRDKEPKYSHLKRDPQMAQWAENVKLYTSGKRKRGDYLKIAKETGQMNESEITERLVNFDKHGKNLDDYNRGGIFKGVDLG